MTSRRGKPLGRYFPEVVAAGRLLPPELVLDGELVVPTGGGVDFAALQRRLHPSVRSDYAECLEEKRREDEYEARNG